MKTLFLVATMLSLASHAGTELTSRNIPAYKLEEGTELILHETLMFPKNAWYVGIQNGRQLGSKTGLDGLDYLKPYCIIYSEHLDEDYIARSFNISIGPGLYKLKRKGDEFSKGTVEWDFVSQENQRNFSLRCNSESLITKVTEKMGIYGLYTKRSSRLKLKTIQKVLGEIMEINNQ